MFAESPAGNYRLGHLWSPCIDVGLNAAVPTDDNDIDHDLNTGEGTPDLDVTDRLKDGLQEGGGTMVDLGAYEFEPPFCPWDCQATPDSNVGINDFLDLLAQWYLVGVPCDFGLGAAGVDINDFLALLANWGPCIGQAESPPQSVQDCINRFGTENPLVLQHCICAVEPCTEGCPPGPTCD